MSNAGGVSKGPVPLVVGTAKTVAERGDDAIETAAMLATLASMSRLPLSLFDPTVRLEMDQIRELFGQRVIGQDEPHLVVEGKSNDEDRTKTFPQR